MAGWGRSAYRELNGYVRADGYDYAWQAGGYYRDEVFFSTASGEPEDLAITLDLAAWGNTHAGDDAMAYLSMGWSLYAETDVKALGLSSLIDLSGPGEQSSYDGPLTFHTIESPYSADGGYLIQSGGYVPSSQRVGNRHQRRPGLGRHGGVRRIQRLPERCATRSHRVDDLGCNPVVEPATALLLGLGLTVVATVSRKLRS